MVGKPWGLGSQIAQDLAHFPWEFPFPYSI